MLPRFAADKANHFVYGALTACLGSFHSIEVGLLLGLAVALGKEVYDFVTRRGVPEVKDFIATVGGVLVVLAPQIGGAL